METRNQTNEKSTKKHRKIKIWTIWNHFTRGIIRWSGLYLTTKWELITFFSSTSSIIKLYDTIFKTNNSIIWHTLWHFPCDNTNLARDSSVIDNDHRHGLRPADQTSLEQNHRLSLPVSHFRLYNCNVWQVTFARYFKRKISTFQLTGWHRIDRCIEYCVVLLKREFRSRS